MNDSQRHHCDLLVARFAEWLQALQYAPRTVSDYRQRVTVLVDWVAAQTTVQTLTDLTPAHLQQFQIALSTGDYLPQRTEPRHLSVTTQAGFVSIVRTFFSWLVQTQQLASNPASGLRLPRLGQRLPRTILTTAEARRLLASCAGDDPLSLRDRAIVETLYGTAVRRAELLALTLTDLNLTGGTLTIRHGKGGRARVLPLTAGAQTALARYLTLARPKLVRAQAGGRTSEALFVASQTGGPLTRNTLQALLHRAAQRAGLRKAVTPHVLRHSCATHLLAGHADIRHIQQLLGHQCLASTQIYTRVEVSDLRAVVQRCHPRGKAR